jgi:hypothetical protein
MADNKTSTPKKSFSADWLVGGILAKLGESFDKLTGRNWKPSSTLATSELIERLKRQLDVKVKDLGEKGRFVPHNIKLKMQWDKFSTDAEKSLQKLQNELHAAAIDHINDNRYHTYAPLKVEVKPDYFTEGVDLYLSFEKFAEEESEDVVKVTMPQVSLQNIVINPEPEPEPEPEKFVAAFRAGEREKAIELEFKPGKRLSVGRTKENNLMLDDASVSKNHASLVLNGENQLMVADTGSTNGTFINAQRIAYGKAFTVGETDKVKFGTVEVFFRRVPKPADFATRESYETEDLKTQNLPLVIAPEAVSREAVEPIPAPPQNQTAEIYKTNEDANIYRTNDDFAVDNKTENNRNNQNDSQIFETRQGIKLDFDDDGK